MSMVKIATEVADETHTYRLNTLRKKIIVVDSAINIRKIFSNQLA